MLESPRGLFSITICGSMVFSYVYYMRIHCFLKDEEKRPLVIPLTGKIFPYFQADDDTFVNINRLKKLLRRIDPMSRSYLGYLLHHRNRFWMSGGAGYVLSSDAFQALVPKLAEDKFKNMKVVAEDAMIGYLMADLQATFIHLEINVSSIDNSLSKRKSYNHHHTHSTFCSCV